MKILTLNLWGTRGPSIRQKILLAALREIQADLMCLQEATDLETLSTLPAAPTFLHVPEAGLAILGQLPYHSHRTLRYRTTSTLESTERGLLLAELQLQGHPLWVATTHLSWKEEDEPTRLGQVGELLGAVAPLNGAVLLAGDFNAAPEALSIRRIRQAGFVDLFENLHPGEAGITWDNRNPFIQQHEVKFPDRRIDYLFLRKETPAWLAPARCEVVMNHPTPEGDFPSDHYGVLATLTPFEKT